MSKKKNFYPEEFYCPDCREIFDSEARSPFLGSCGHSLCGECVNETKTCPVCKKEEAFATKQENKLAAEIFATLMKAKEYQFPAILEPEYHPFFAQILNNLDPRSFVNLARTCETMHELCFNSSGVRITYDIPWLMFSTFDAILRFEMEEVGGEEGSGVYLKTVKYKGDKFGFLGSAVNRKTLQKYPFVFNLRKIDIDGVFETEWISQMRKFLAEFPIKSISGLKAMTIDDWPGFIQFVKDFHITDVSIRTRDMPGRAESRSIPDEAAAFFLQNMVRFRIDVPIADGLILNTSAQRLHLKRANISKETFVELIKKLAHSTDEVNWMIYRQPFDVGHYNLFRRVHIDHVEEFDGPLPEERPLLFGLDDIDDDADYDVEDDEWIDEFKILRADGKYLSCEFYREYVMLSTSADPWRDRERDDGVSLFGLDDDGDDDSDDDEFTDEESDEDFEDESSDESDH